MTKSNQNNTKAKKARPKFKNEENSSISSESNEATSSPLTKKYSFRAESVCSEIAKFFPEIPMPPTDEFTDELGGLTKGYVSKKANKHRDLSWITDEHVEGYLKLIQYGKTQAVASARTGVPIDFIRDRPHLQALEQIARELHLEPFKEKYIQYCLEAAVDPNVNWMATKEKIAAIQWYLTRKSPGEFNPNYLLAKMKAGESQNSDISANSSQVTINLNLKELEALASEKE